MKVLAEAVQRILRVQLLREAFASRKLHGLILTQHSGERTRLACSLRHPRRSFLLRKVRDREGACAPQSSKFHSESAAFFWNREVFNCDNLPTSVATQPGVSPDEATALACSPLPRFVALRDDGVAVKPDFHFVEVNPLSTDKVHTRGLHRANG